LNAAHVELLWPLVCILASVLASTVVGKNYATVTSHTSPLWRFFDFDLEIHVSYLYLYLCLQPLTLGQEGLLATKKAFWPIICYHRIKSSGSSVKQYSFQCLSNLSLKAFTDGADATSLGRDSSL